MIKGTNQSVFFCQSTRSRQPCSVGLLLLAAFAFALFSSSARALDWFRYRGPDLNGISKETGWQTKWPEAGPKKLWKASVGTGFSSVSVSNGRAYTLGNDGNNTDTVFCFDARTGDVVWKHSYPCDLDPKYYEGGPSGTPTVDHDRVYTLSRKGDLFCLDAAKGDVVWSKNLHGDLGDEIPTWGFAGSPLVEGNLLILNAGSAGTALDKRTGNVVWASDKGPPGYATPVPFGSGRNRSVAIMASKTLEVVRVADGKFAWHFPWKTTYDVNAADPVIVSDDTMFISSGYGHGCALLKFGGGKPTVAWENKNMRNHFSTSVLWQGHLYGVDENELKCLALDTGEVKWSEKTFGKGSLTMADGKIIGLSDKGELMVAEPSPKEFKPISRAQVLGGKCWTMPVLSNGRIYCRNARGDLVCLEVSGQ